MPGPVSDSYDPDFGTGANRLLVQEAIEEVGNKICDLLGPRLSNIIDIARAENGSPVTIQFSERELRLIRFSLNLAQEALD